MSLTLTASNRCFQGEQRYYQHSSTSTSSPMSFSIYLPDAALARQPCTAIMYLSGLTCSPDNVTHKAHFQQLCSELDVIFIAPDTSPKGEAIPDDECDYVGQAASYYVDASQSPWAENFQMQTYLVDELYGLLREHFPIASMGLMGHSMGGHGALLLAFKYPSLFISVSALSPICALSESAWGQQALTAMMGADSSSWADCDASQVIRKVGRLYPEVLVDQGMADEFFTDGQLQTDKLMQACQAVSQPLSLRYHAGFDHSYYFIQSFINDHISHHWRASQLHCC